MIRRWEVGECLPTASKFLAVCTLQRIDLEACIEAFYGRRPSWLNGVADISSVAASRLLADHKGKRHLESLAHLTGFSRYQLSRWVHAQSEPRLDEFLRVLDVCTQRLPDLIALLVAPERVPAIAEAWIRLERARALAYEFPWSQAVLRALEVETDPGSYNTHLDFLAHKLGCPEETIVEALQALEQAGQIVSNESGWVPNEVTHINTSKESTQARKVKATWTRIALSRLERGDPGFFGYTVFSVSQADLRKIRDLQLDYIRAIEGIITQSTRSECVGLLCVQLLDLASTDVNALTS